MAEKAQMTKKMFYNNDTRCYSYLKNFFVTLKCVCSRPKSNISQPALVEEASYGVQL